MSEYVKCACGCGRDTGQLAIEGALQICRIRGHVVKAAESTQPRAVSAKPKAKRRKPVANKAKKPAENKGT